MSVPKLQAEEMLVAADYKTGEGPASDDHLRNLKALTEKLRLETRRPSYLEWKVRLEGLTWKCHPKPPEEEEEEGEEEEEEEDYQDKNALEESVPLRRTQGQVTEVPSEQLTSEKSSGFANIDEALNWLRKELVSGPLRKCNGILLGLSCTC
uniref:Family with sequence similarity 167 member A n=1 Tax=Varanus komodoensis TaxID=61221 RepID=A0A8D2J900_VARKO